MSGAGAEAGLAAWARTSRWNPGHESWGEHLRFRGHAGPGAGAGEAGSRHLPPSPLPPLRLVTAEDGGRRNQPHHMCVHKTVTGQPHPGVLTQDTPVLSRFILTAARGKARPPRCGRRDRAQDVAGTMGEAVYERAFTFRRKCDVCIYASYTRAYPFRLIGISSCVHEVYI